MPDNLDGPSLPRTKAYTTMLTECMDLKTLWDDYGIAGEVKVSYVWFANMLSTTRILIAIYLLLPTC